MAKEFTYEIVQPVAVLARSANGRYTTELNYISFNGQPAKLDLRKWDREKGKMFKGITLNEEEVAALKAVLCA